ncbi:putative receptor-like protein kinase, partial [Mucuna pruriens]
MDQEESTKMHIDNKFAQILVKNLVFHERSKHIDTRYHFIRECIVKKEVELVHVKTQDQVADIFTKSLKFEDFRRLRGINLEFGSKGIICTKGDVFSFGIMLMETFSRKKPTDELFVDGLSMKGWISESLHHVNGITRVVDSNLLHDEEHRAHDVISSISSIYRIALNCCADLPEERMNMTDVAASLNKIKTIKHY